MRFKKVVPSLFLLILFSNCSSGSAIITGQARPAVNPEEVKIYIEPPPQYEIIGLIEASSEVEFSTQAAQDRVIKELKEQAAKIGANGIISLNIDSQGKPMYGFCAGAIFYAGQAETKKGKGQAIYVKTKGE